MEVALPYDVARADPSDAPYQLLQANGARLRAAPHSTAATANATLPPKLRPVCPAEQMCYVLPHVTVTPKQGHKAAEAVESPETCVEG